MNIAEIILFLAVIVGVYFILKPVQVRLERWLLSWMGRSSGRKGQGAVYKIKREDN